MFDYPQQKIYIFIYKIKCPLICIQISLIKSNQSKTTIKKQEKQNSKNNETRNKSINKREKLSCAALNPPNSDTKITPYRQLHAEKTQPHQFHPNDYLPPNMTNKRT